MGQNNLVSIGIWGLIVTTVWFVAWIIAEAIPVFNDLLSLISALFASWFTYGLSGIFWLFMNYGRYRESKKKMFLTGLNTTIFLIGAVIVSFSNSSLLCHGYGILIGSIVRFGIVCVWDGYSF